MNLYSHLKSPCKLARATVLLLLLSLLLGVTVSCSRKKQDAYRTITVASVSGDATVSNDKGKDVPAYEGMALYDGDTVTVAEGASLSILLDGDKYLLAEGGTTFSLEATGKKGQEKTVIHLDRGSALTRIKTQLGEDQSFVIQSPTSTISVRGTVYRVDVVRDASGVITVKHDCFDGVIEVAPIGADGKPTEDPERITAGFSADVTAAADGHETPAFVRDENGQVQEKIDMDEFSEEIIEELIDFIEDGENLFVGKDELEEFLPTVSTSPATEAETEPITVPETETETEPETEIESPCNGNHVFGPGVKGTDAGGTTVSFHTCLFCPVKTQYPWHECLPNRLNPLFNETVHWFPCAVDGCPSRHTYEDHQFTEAVLRDPTHEQWGLRGERCRCGYTLPGSEQAYEFSALYLVFDEACGHPSFDMLDDQNTLHASEPFMYTQIKVYGMYTDSYGADGLPILQADGTPVHGRLLRADEYSFQFYHLSYDAEFDGQWQASAAGYMNPGRHGIQISYGRDLAGPRAHFTYTVYADEAS